MLKKIDLGVLHSTVKAEYDISDVGEEDIVEPKWRSFEKFGELGLNGGSYYPLTKNAFRQFCRVTRIPLSFFMSSTDDLKARIMKERTSRLKGSWKAHMFTRNGKQMVRGVTTSDTVSIPLHQVLETLGNVKGLDAVMFNGVGVEDSVYHVRGVVGSQPILKDDMFVGVSAVGSEINMCDAAVEVVIYKQICENGAIVSFGRGPFYHRNYEGIDSAELMVCIEGAVNKGIQLIPLIDNMVKKATSENWDRAKIKSSVSSILNHRNLSKGFGLKVKVMAETEPEPIDSRMKFVNVLTLAAQDLPTVGRIRHERYAGMLMGMNFKRQ